MANINPILDSKKRDKTRPYRYIPRYEEKTYPDNEDKYFYKELAKERAKEKIEKFKDLKKRREKYLNTKNEIIKDNKLKKLIITLKIRGAVKYDIPEFLPSYIKGSNQDISNKIYFDISNNFNYNNIKNFYIKNKIPINNITDTKSLFTNVYFYEKYLKYVNNNIINEKINDIYKKIKYLKTNVYNIEKKINVTYKISPINKDNTNQNLFELNDNINLNIENIKLELINLEEKIIYLQTKLIELINYKLINLTMTTNVNWEDNSKGGTKKDINYIETLESKSNNLNKNYNYLLSLIFIYEILNTEFVDSSIINIINEYIINIKNKKKLLLDDTENINPKDNIEIKLKNQLSKINITKSKIKDILNKIINEKNTQVTKINWEKGEKIDDKELDKKKETVSIDIINEDDEDKKNSSGEKKEDVVINNTKIDKKEYDITINNIDYITNSFFNSKNKLKFYNKEYLIHSYLWDNKYKITTRSNLKIIIILYVYEEEPTSEKDKELIFNRNLSCKIKKDKLYNDFLNLFGYENESQELKYRIKRERNKNKRNLLLGIRQQNKPYIDYKYRKQYPGYKEQYKTLYRYRNPEKIRYNYIGGYSKIKVFKTIKNKYKKSKKNKSLKQRRYIKNINKTKRRYHKNIK